MAGKGYTFAGVCKGVTKAGTSCRRTVVFANGYCRAHGGDSTKFMRERLANIKAKALPMQARVSWWTLQASRRAINRPTDGRGQGARATGNA